MNLRKFLFAAAAVILTSASASHAADYPEKPINAIVGFSAGGGVDTYARALAAGIEGHLNGQPLVVVNKPGGAQIPAMKFVAGAEPDGYTVIVFSVGSGLFATMQRDRGVDTFDDFTPVAQIGDNHLVLLASKESGFETPQDIIAAIEKAHGEGRKLRWGHAGRGGITQMAALAWLIKNDVYDKVQDVPFQGGSKARAAIVGNQIDFASVALTNITGFEDQMNVVGIFSGEREPTKPDVPTIGDHGSAYTPMSNPIIIMGPKGMPEDRVNTLAAAIEQAVQTDKYKEITSKAGQPVVYKSPEDSARYLEELRDEWQPVAEFAMEHLQN